MKKFMLTTLAVTFATPLFAEPSCTPGDSLKPVWEAIKTFEDEGGEVLKFKINDGGCYEVYGKLDDTKMEVFFDPNTGVEIDRINS